jgi:hypothetical protein
MERHVIILPLALVSAATQAAISLELAPEGTTNVFSVPLVPSSGLDDAEPTHMGCSHCFGGGVGEWMRDNLGQFPGALWRAG